MRHFNFMISKVNLYEADCWISPFSCFLPFDSFIRDGSWVLKRYRFIFWNIHIILIISKFLDFTWFGFAFWVFFSSQCSDTLLGKNQRSLSCHGIVTSLAYFCHYDPFINALRSYGQSWPLAFPGLQLLIWTRIDASAFYQAILNRVANCKMSSSVLK